MPETFVIGIVVFFGMLASAWVGWVVGSIMTPLPPSPRKTAVTRTRQQRRGRMPTAADHAGDDADGEGSDERHFVDPRAI